jgi:hypothetical protein
MATKNKNRLQINSFKTWTYGNYTITQYKRLMFIISTEQKDIWQTKTLRKAVKWSDEHAKSK